MYKIKKEKSGKELTFLTEIRPYFLLGILQGQEDSFGNVGVSIIEKGRVVFTTLPKERAGQLYQQVNVGKLRDQYFFEQTVKRLPHQQCAGISGKQAQWPIVVTCHDRAESRCLQAGKKF